MPRQQQATAEEPHTDRVSNTRWLASGDMETPSSCHAGKGPYPLALDQRAPHRQAGKCSP
jgi:hypothetical protein